MKNSHRMLLVAFAALFAGRVSAAETIASGANLALPLLENGGSARAMAMGSTYVGVDEGSAALLWNPAGLGTMQNGDVAIHHDSGLAGSIQEIAVLGMPMGNLGGFAGAVNYVDNGSFEGRDSSGNLTSNYGAGDIGASLGWGKELLPGVSLGVDAKVNQQNLGPQSNASVAADVGALWSPLPNLKLGLAYNNLGTQVAGSPLDSGFRLGGSYGMDLAPDNRLLLAASVENQTGGDTFLQAGAEDTIDACLALRLGYQYNLMQQQLSGLTDVSAGVGLEIDNFSLDYAYVPFGDLGASQYLSLTYHFSGNAYGRAAHS